MTEERLTTKNTGKRSKTWSVDDDHIRRTSGYIRHTWRGRWLYRLMMTLMGFESILWTLMDIVRSWRMKIAETITKNKHNDRV